MLNGYITRSTKSSLLSHKAVKPKSQAYPASADLQEDVAVLFIIEERDKLHNVFVFERGVDLDFGH